MVNSSARVCAEQTQSIGKNQELVPDGSDSSSHSGEIMRREREEVTASWMQGSRIIQDLRAKDGRYGCKPDPKKYREHC